MFLIMLAGILCASCPRDGNFTTEHCGVLRDTPSKGLDQGNGIASLLPAESLSRVAQNRIAWIWAGGPGLQRVGRGGACIPAGNLGILSRKVPSSVPSCPANSFQEEDFVRKLHLIV